MQDVQKKSFVKIDRHRFAYRWLNPSDAEPFGYYFPRQLRSDSSSSALNFNSLLNWTVSDDTIDYIRDGVPNRPPVLETERVGAAFRPRESQAQAALLPKPEVERVLIYRNRLKNHCKIS